MKLRYIFVLSGYLLKESLSIKFKRLEGTFCLNMKEGIWGTDGVDNGIGVVTRSGSRVSTVLFIPLD